MTQAASTHVRHRYSSLSLSLSRAARLLQLRSSCVTTDAVRVESRPNRRQTFGLVSRKLDARVSITLASDVFRIWRSQAPPPPPLDAKNSASLGVQHMVSIRHLQLLLLLPPPAGIFVQVSMVGMHRVLAVTQTGGYFHFWF